jgi:hypothetical protein
MEQKDETELAKKERVQREQREQLDRLVAQKKELRTVVRPPNMLVAVSPSYRARVPAVAGLRGNDAEGQRC